MDYIDIIQKFTDVDISYDTSDFSETFDNLISLLLEKCPSGLYTGIVYRVHDYIGNIEKTLNLKENQIVFKEKDYTHWSKRKDIYNFIFSDAHPRNSVFEPFIFIKGFCENGIDVNELMYMCLKDYPGKDKRKYNEKEIIYTLKKDNIKKVWIVYDRNDKSKWIDVTEKIICKKDY